MEREKMLEKKRKYFKKYYQEHKDYYRQKSKEQREKYGVSMYKYKLDKGLNYIENEIFKGKEDMDWYRRNGGCISGSDLPCEVILDLYDILKGGR